MILFRGNFSRSATPLVCFLFCAPALFAAVSDSPEFRAGATNVPPIPTLLAMKSPVDTFRELLSMNPTERRLFLTNRPPETQKRILAKLREYQLLKPEERELRLQATELQWYLQPLMSIAPTNRTVRLAAIPAEQRQLIEKRLERWDRLPASLQEQLLNDEMTSRYFTQSQISNNWSIVLSKMSPERRAKLEAGLDRWRNFSEEQRRNTMQGFNAFFELTPQEKQKAINTLSEAEQQQMEKTLQAYAHLPVAQRMQCIQSFEKFTGMSLGERQLFLKNAERWKLMPPAERETWRKLVSYAPLQPPLPTPTTPLPPPPLLHRPTNRVATTN